MERIAMKIDIKKIWNKHFGIEEEPPPQGALIKSMGLMISRRS